MSRHHGWGVATGLALAVHATIGHATIPAMGGEPFGPHWSTRAIVEVPKVLETAITVDGRVALYITRVNNLAADKRESHLYAMTTATGDRRELLSAAWISDLAAIPGSKDWSLRADLGQGVQLYRLSLAGQVTPIVVKTPTVMLGTDTTVAIADPIIESDQAFGVLGYGWSSDGNLWYATAHTVPVNAPRLQILENPLIPLDAYVPNVSELHVVDYRGNDRIVASARGAVTPYPTIIYGENAARWIDETRSGGRQLLAYRAATAKPNGATTFADERYDPGSGISMASDRPDTHGQSPDQRTGPHAGILKLIGPAGAQHLVEWPEAGPPSDYGQVSLTLTWWNSRTDWHFPSLGASLHGVRFTGDNVRNGLIELTSDNRMRILEPALSLNSCAFSETAATGICVREGRDHPPELVSINVRSGSVETLAAVDARYDAIKPLHSEPRTWKAGTLEATGFLLYPRNYDPKGHYPAIIVTHGYDADNSFANKDFQWSYPAQMWAERGYVVIAVNDIPITQSEERAKAYDQWTSASNDLPVDKVYDLVWRDNVRVYAGVIQSLAGNGLVDPDRVGIAGFSRGSQMVEVAVSQTHLFKAASSGDGGMFAPTSYWSEATHGMYKGLFGGSPFDPQYGPNWRMLSPTIRADQVRTPVLFQIAKTLSMRVDFYQALRDQSVPAEFAFWPAETHQFHSPIDQITAMEQNLDWFDFWLKGLEDPDPAKAVQYRRWEEMRDQKAVTK